MAADPEPGHGIIVHVGNNPVNFVDPFGLAPKDKLYGYPKRFWQWYHRNVKSPGDPDLDKTAAGKHYEEWQALGKPGPDTKMGRGRCEIRSPRGGRGPKGLRVMGVFQFFQIMFDAYDAQKRADEYGVSPWTIMIYDMYGIDYSADSGI